MSTEPTVSLTDRREFLKRTAGCALAVDSSSVLLARTPSVEAADVSHAADWLKDARLGVFMHFLPGDPQGLSKVDDFDVPALTRQLKAMGVSYTAGELNEPFDVLPASRWVDGSQWHALTYLGSSWGRRDTRQPTERWVRWVQAAVEKCGAVTLDLGPNWNPAVGPIGTFDEAQVAQAKAVHQGLLDLKGK